MIHAGVHRAATQCEELGSGSWGVHACSAQTKSRRLCTSTTVKSGVMKAMSMRNNIKQGVLSNVNAVIF